MSGEYQSNQSIGMQTKMRLLSRQLFWSVRARTFLLPLGMLCAHFLIQSFVVGIFTTLALFGSKNLTAINLSSPIFQQAISLGLFVSAIIQCLCYFFILLSINRRYPAHAGFLPTRPSQYALAIPLAFTALASAQLSIYFLTALGEHLHFFQWQLSEYEQYANRLFSSDNVLNFLSVVILVPIAEELLFRGIIMGEIKRVCRRPWLTILLGGTIFAIAHFNVIQSAYVFLVGILFAAVYVMTDSLFLTIIMHIIFNFFGRTGQTHLGIYVMSVIGLICFIILLVQFVQDQKRARLLAAQISPDLAKRLKLIPLYLWRTEERAQSGVSTGPLYVPLPFTPNQLPDGYGYPSKANIRVNPVVMSFGHRQS